MVVIRSGTFIVSITDDRELNLAFQEWSLANHVYSVAGSSAGPTFLERTLAAEHEPKVREFFRQWHEKTGKGEVIDG